MSTQIQRRRGTTTEHGSFTGALAELTVDTTKDTVVVHDGTTVGGHPLAKENLSNVPAGTITSTMVADGTLVNADINASAAIAGTKISPDFGSQNTTTTGTSTAASFIPTSSTVPSNGVYLPAANNVAISTNGVQRLLISSTGAITGSSTITAGGTIEALQTFQSSSGTDVVLNANGANRDAIFKVNGTELMRLQGSTGRLGLGTSSPAGTLHVNGQTYIQGAVSGGNANSTLIANASGQAQIWALGADTSTTGSMTFVVARSNLSTATQAITIDSSARVGIGSTAPGEILTINGSSNAASRLRLYNQSTDIGALGSHLGMVGSGLANDLMLSSATSNNLTFGIGYSEKARIDTSGRLLVGTSSYSGSGAGFEIEGTGNFGPQIRSTAKGSDQYPSYIVLRKSRGSSIVQNGDFIFDIEGQGYDGASYIKATSIRAEVDGTPGTNDMPGRLVFSTTADGASSPTERMRIGSAGQILFGCTSAPNPGSGSTASGFAVNGTGNDGYLTAKIDNSPVGYFRRDGTDGTLFDFRKGSTTVGTISVTASATAYNTSSDYRLKENVVPLTGAIDRINDLQVHRFNFIADPDKTVDGFIAHEAQEVVPECVTGTKDQVDVDGNPVYQGIDQSKLVPLLTAALQEALAEIESLKARVTALEP